nr:extensin family protein [Roseibacterium persicicum]
MRPAGRPGSGIAEPEPAPAAVAAVAPPPAIERRGLFGGIFRPQDQPRPGVPAVAGTFAADRSPRPEVRPDGLEQRVRAAATRQTPSRVAQSGTRGALCGVPGLVGDRLEPITGRISGCGVADPVRLREVDGIALSTPATVNCQTARALQEWVQRSLVPTVGRRGGGVSSLRVVASYACRTRNNQAGARISEHGRGNAIDIAGIGLANGTELTVLGGWRDNRTGPILRELHRGACGPFGTVLGPNSDRFHQDHLHFDTASYRSGPYCR